MRLLHPVPEMSRAEFLQHGHERVEIPQTLHRDAHRRHHRARVTHETRGLVPGLFGDIFKRREEFDRARGDLEDFREERLSRGVDRVVGRRDERPRALHRVHVHHDVEEWGGDFSALFGDVS